MTDAVMKKSQSLTDWLSYLEHVHPITIDMGLDRVRAVAQKANLLQLPGRVITVGGTNGKGTTCAMLSSILQAAGYRTGVYASPHILHYNERITIEGQPVSDSDLCEAFTYIEEKRGDISLTFFEYGTLAAFYLFRKARLDVVILEVGLGGRLDATNIIDADVSVITSIALDHCQLLGDTRELIAIEKAGIYRKNRPAINGEPDSPATLIESAQHIGAQLVSVGVDYHYTVQGQFWTFDGQFRHINGLPIPVLPLPNAVTVLATLEQFERVADIQIADSAIRSGLQLATLPGRFQQIQQHPRVIVDVAHNPHAAAYLAQRIQQITDRPVMAVVGMLKDKDIEHTLNHVVPWVKSWFLADLEGPRAASADMLAQYLPEQAHTECYHSVHEAYQQALHQAADDDIIIVFGSFLTIASVLEIGGH